MDVNKAYELSKLATNQVKLAKEYCEARKKAGEAKKDLDILLVSELSKIREEKSNVGYDMAILMLMERVDAAKGIYAQMVEQTSLYKGLERMIEAIKSKISLEQSIMKYIGEGEKYGV